MKMIKIYSIKYNKIQYNQVGYQKRLKKKF